MMTNNSDKQAPSEWAWENFDRDDAAGYRRTDAQKNYDVLRDTIIAAFNPADEDAAEPSIMTGALDCVWRFVVKQPCTCPPGAGNFEDDPCERCRVLGRAADVEVER